MEFTFSNFNIFYLISVVLGIILIVQGIRQLRAKKPLGEGWEEYTPESVRDFSVVTGIGFIFAGISLALTHFIVFGGNAEVSVWVMYGVTVLIALLLIPISLVVLKKKSAKKTVAKTAAKKTTTKKK